MKYEGGLRNSSYHILFDSVIHIITGSSGQKHFDMIRITIPRPGFGARGGAHEIRQTLQDSIKDGCTSLQSQPDLENVAATTNSGDILS